MMREITKDRQSEALRLEVEAFLKNKEATNLGNQNSIEKGCFNSGLSNTMKLAKQGQNKKNHADFIYRRSIQQPILIYFRENSKMSWNNLARLAKLDMNPSVLASVFHGKTTIKKESEFKKVEEKIKEILGNVK